MANVYAYPSDITKASSYLTFTRYKNKGFTTTELRTIDNKFNNFSRVPTGMIALPVPNGFTDSSSVNYQDSTDNSLLEGMGQNLINSSATAQQALSLAKTNIGQTLSAQQYMLFSGVSVKSYQLTWNLIPESRKEANDIISIIKFFELAKLPYFTELSSSFMNFPDIIDIDWGGSVKPNFIRFLPSVITGINHNIGDHYQIYSDGNFPEIVMSLQLSEITSRTRDIEQTLY